MGKLKLKSEQLFVALDRLYEAAVDFDEFEKHADSIKFIQKDRVYRTFRDSLIQRFEFSVDLFWKYVKRYLQEALKLKIELNAPKPIIRDACQAKLISEEDAEKIILMIMDRNMSSHIYKEEVADDISSRIRWHYDLMKKYAEKLKAI